MNLYPQFSEWLNRINTSEKPESSIIAFNFGLLETPDGYALYLIGAKEFDESDSDWACDTDFEPKEKYLRFNLPEIKEKKWDEFLQIAITLLSQYIRSGEFKSSILKNAVAITTGFDDGDLTRVK